MKLQSSGMFYYFSSEDELIIACAEEATLRMEKILIATAIKEVRTPATLMETLQKKAIEMAPTMKFFSSVCSDKSYEELIKSVLQRMGERYSKYCNK